MLTINVMIANVIVTVTVTVIVMTIVTLIISTVVAIIVLFFFKKLILQALHHTLQPIDVWIIFSIKSSLETLTSYLTLP